MMIKCSNCGAEMPAGTKFCTKCGHDLRQSQANATESAAPASGAAEALKCPNCGTPYEAGTKFCTTCGTALTDDAPQAQATVQTQPATPAQAAPAGPNAAQLYWRWFVGSLKKPAAVVQPTFKGSGLINLAAESLFFILALLFNFKRTISSYATSSGLSEWISSSVINEITGKLNNYFIQGWLFALVGTGVILGVGAFLHTITANKQSTDFLAYSNEIAHNTNLVLVLNLALLLLGLMLEWKSFAVIAIVILVVDLTSLSAALYRSVMHDNAKLDPLYAALLMGLAIPLVSFLVMRLGGTEIFTQIKQDFESLW